MDKPPIDWNALADRAANMTATEIRDALLDINLTLPNADALDREDSGNRGGTYRDEISVYRAELKKREAK